MVPSVYADSHFMEPFSRWTWVSRYQNVSSLDFMGAKDDRGGGDNWSYKMCKTPVKSSPPTNKTPNVLQARCPSCHPINSIKAHEGKLKQLLTLKYWYRTTVIILSFCYFPSVLRHCWLGNGKGIRPVKKLDVGLLVVMIWLELCIIYSSSSPVVTSISIILCINQLTQVHLENGR